MRNDKQRARQRKSRDKRKQRNATERLERAERKLSKAIQTVRATEQRGAPNLKRHLNKCRTGTLRRTQSGRILSTTEGYVQGPVPVRVSS